MKKKSLAIILALVLLLSIAVGCQQAPTPPAGGQQAPPPEAQPANGGAEEAAPDAAAEFFRGQRITIVLGQPAGGTVDLAARALIPFIQDYTGASVIIEYQEGAAGVVAANYMYNRASRDGLTLSLMQASVLMLSQLGGAEGVAYDVSSFNWVACLGSDPRIYVTYPGSRLEAAELVGESITLAASVPGFSPGSLCDMLLAEILEANGGSARLITGYVGLAGRRLAVQQRETDMTWQHLASYNEFVEGTLSPVFIFDRDRIDRIPEVPTIFELGLTIAPEIQSLFDTVLEVGAFNMMMFTPPDVPEYRLEFLRNMFAEIITNQDLIQVFEDAFMGTNFASPHDVQDWAGRVYDLVAANVDAIHALIDKYR